MPAYIVKEFFEASLYKRLDSFDFDNAFNVLGGFIDQKLAQHGLLSLEEFQEYEEEIMCGTSDALSGYAVETNYIYISTDELHDALMKYKYKKYRDAFEDYGSFKELKRIHDDIQNISGGTIQDMVLLMERIIHAQHETGEVFEDYFNPDDIRADVEREYKALMNGEI